MTEYLHRRVRGWMKTEMWVVLGWVLSGPASAQLLDDVSVRSDQGVAEIRLQFTAPVRYVRHFPSDHGELLKLYLQVVKINLDEFEERDRQEYKPIPTIPQLPPFSVVYSTVRSCNSAPDPLCLDIQFKKPVRFSIRPGNDGRSIVLHVIPDNGSAGRSAAFQQH